MLFTRGLNSSHAEKKKLCAPVEELFQIKVTVFADPRKDLSRQLESWGKLLDLGKLAERHCRSGATKSFSLQGSITPGKRRCY